MGRKRIKTKKRKMRVRVLSPMLEMAGKLISTSGSKLCQKLMSTYISLKTSRLKILLSIWESPNARYKLREVKYCAKENGVNLLFKTSQSGALRLPEDSAFCK